jgi:hypothetical protein
LIQGIVTEDGVPGIEVDVGTHRWRAIVDTGFNGELELPERLRPQVNARFVAARHRFWPRIDELRKTSSLSTSHLTATWFERKRLFLKAARFCLARDCCGNIGCRLTFLPRR